MKKWLRRALLGGVAMTVMAAGAQADELSALKAQLESLQARVATMEARAAAIPEGASLVTFERGNSGLVNHELFARNAFEQIPASRGATIAITPTADLPAPVASIELSGLVRAMFFWHDSDDIRPGDLTHFHATARGDINIAMTTDTAVGRLTGGIQLRGDFGRAPNNDPATGPVADAAVNMRTAWFNWQMTDALSMTMGHTAQIARLDNVSSPLVAASMNPFGPDNSRRSQLRFTYNMGALNLRFGIEDASQDADNTAMPDFAASMGYTIGPVGFRIGGEVGRVQRRPLASNFTGYLVNAGINFNLGTLGSFNGGVVYTYGLGCDGLLQSTIRGTGRVVCAAGTNVIDAVGAQANFTFSLTETISWATSFGYVNANNGGAIDEGYSIGSALLWQPVDALRFGAGFDYRTVEQRRGGARWLEDLTVGFGGWYIF